MIARFRSLSLRYKLFLTSVGMVLLISGVIALVARGILLGTLHRELELRGAAIAQSIAERGGGYVLDKDQAGLVALLFDAAQLGERKALVSYLFITNADGELLAHTFIRPFPGELLRANVNPEGQQTSARQVSFDGQEAVDIAVPMQEGIYTLGTVHVGLRQRHIDALEDKLRLTFLGFISLVGVIFFLLALTSSGYVVRPLLRLTKAAESISRGQLDQPLELDQELSWDPRECPAYGDTDLPCWHLDQLDKAPDHTPPTCNPCKFYRSRSGDEVVQLANAFANMVWSIKLYRNRLRESEERYRPLFDANPDAFLVLRVDTLRFLDANPRAQELYGYSKRELLDMTLAGLEPADNPTGVHRFLQDPGPERQVLSSKVRHFRRGKEPIFVNVHACRANYLGREVVIFSAVDVTELVEKDAQLIQASKMKTLGEMSAGMAHELNQPLNAIKLGSDLLALMHEQGQCVLPERFSRVLSQISAQVDRAARIIAHLREFGRKSELTPDAVDINTPIRGVFTLIGQQLALQNIAVDLDLTEGLPRVLAHSNRLEQVFFNLVNNARDAIQLLRAQRGGDSYAEISIRSWLEDGRVAVSVSDTGCGIEPQALQKIFEPFFTTKEAGEGMGLGLAISYGILKDYDGDIAVGSEVGEGTTFKVTFPAAA